MNVKVYAITPNHDLWMGTATDNTTLLSLIELAKIKFPPLGVSLHGTLQNGVTISGEMSHDDASNLAFCRSVS